MLLSELRLRDLPDAALLEGTSIDAATLANPRAIVPGERWVALLLRAIDLTGDPALGVAMGENWSQSMLQVVGQLIVSCPTMREAIKVFERYHALLGNNSSWQLEEQGERAFLYCDQLIDHPVAARVGMEAVLTLTYRIGRGFVGENPTRADEVWFSHAEPPYAKQYERVFACPLRFGQPRNALVFSRHLLDVVQPNKDDTMLALLSSSAEALLRERASESVAERVRALLRYENDVSRVDVRYIAARLNMAVRVLRRRLGAEHSPLSNLLDEARLRIAQRELVKPGASIKEVAHSLGFSEASAFHRAFKRWSGQTPAQFMKQDALPGSAAEPLNPHTDSSGA